MRTGAFWTSIASMRRLLKKKDTAYGTPSMELAGALSIASQMALHCPPGFDGWVAKELAGGRHHALPERPAGDLRR
jgi:hypothetical protein